jgi:hypothetical protein
LMTFGAARALREHVKWRGKIIARTSVDVMSGRPSVSKPVEKKNDILPLFFNHTCGRCQGVRPARVRARKEGASAKRAWPIFFFEGTKNYSSVIIAVTNSIWRS